MREKSMCAREKDQNVLFSQLMFMKYLLCARHHENFFTNIILFNLYMALWISLYSYAPSTGQ